MITLYANSSQTIKVSLFEDAEQTIPLDLTGIQDLVFTMKPEFARYENPPSADHNLMQKKDSSGGISIDDAATGQITVYITKADWGTWSVRLNYDFDVRVIDGSGNEQTAFVDRSQIIQPISIP